MKILKFLFVIALLLLSTQNYGQRKYAADQYFKQFAYKKAINLYEQIYKSGDNSKLVLERLGDANYFNTDTKNAEIWYHKLLENYSQEVSSKYFFRFAQALKANGKLEESEEIMKKYKELEPDYSPAKSLVSASDSGYLDLTDKDIAIHNVSTNTEFSDFGGFEKDGEFYFASSEPLPNAENKLYRWNNQPYLNLFQASVTERYVEDVNSEHKVIELFDKSLMSLSINSIFHESNAIITKDGQTMYFTRDNFDGKKKGRDKKTHTTHLKLYRITKEDGKWGDIVELPFNSDNYSVGHPALSPDEKTLYFASDMPGGYGNTDIYKVSVIDNIYGKPVNLGRGINTEEREMFPFVGADSTLYFSSDGHSGHGLLDIFESKLESGEYKTVKNLEEPFNSKRDDIAFYINDAKNEGFFSSNREGGKGDDDIYSFVITKEVCKQTIKGLVTDKKTGKPIPDASVKLVDSEGKIIEIVQSDVEGLYTFTDIDCSLNFTVMGEKMDYKPDQKQVATTSVNGETRVADLVLTPLIIGNQIVINPIYFDFDKYYIRGDAAEELEHIITVLNDHPDMIIKIESHTDCRGTREYNRTLSDNRAKSTRDYIISRGIQPYQIESAIGYGESQPLYDCGGNCKGCTEEEHQLNRRSYFYIVSGGKDVKVQGQY
ncbi:OmpA family protein [Tenacibaculum sp. UWU-22]|uniref:OmpA family protein n=1 Tax=Tenacibaculum sp. UWU-22 TaxID=3234187 RepID=UPI0034DB3B0C